MKSWGRIDLISAHTFFVDVVGLSDPAMPVMNQVKKIRKFTELVSSCRSFKKTSRKSRLILPTGDGMSVNFLQGPELPVNLAIELHEKLRKYNKGKIPDEMIRVRIGLNSGLVYRLKDIEGKYTVWGPGIILAKRVMDEGKPDHILMTGEMAESLREVAAKFNTMIKPLGLFEIKHGMQIKIYNVYGDGFGNKKWDWEKSSFIKPIDEDGDQIIPPPSPTMVENEVSVTLTIKDPKTMLAHHKRVHFIEVKSKEPVKTILHGIATDVAKPFDELNLKITDETGKKLKIGKMFVETDYQKLFTIFLDKPIRKGEKGHGYVIEYDVEEPERFFEQTFNVNCQRFSMSLVFPRKTRFKPVVYDVDIDTDSITKCKTQPKIEKYRNGLVRALWSKVGIVKGEAFRMKW